MFHHFYDSVSHPRGQGAISADELIDLLKYVGIGNVISAEVWFERALEGSLGEHDTCLTFDDALRCQYDIALPVLQDLELTAFWFVYSSVFEGGIGKLEVYRYLRSVCFSSVDEFYVAFEKELADADSDVVDFVNQQLEQFEPESYLVEYPFYTKGDRTFRFIRDKLLGKQRYEDVMDRMVEKSGIDVSTLPSRLWMDDDCLEKLTGLGHVIGLHSYSHPTDLVSLSPEQQFDEYVRNRDHLKRVIGEFPLTVSHPCNSYDETTLSILADLGIRVGFCSNDSEETVSLLEVPRRDHTLITKAIVG